MRNYRIITKQNNMSAWGGGRSQVASPLKDSIKLILPLKLKLNDNTGMNFSDSITFNVVSPSLFFKLNDKHGNFTKDDMTYASSIRNLKLNDIHNFDMEDDTTYEQ